MNVLELAQQIYSDQKRLQAKRIDGYAICPIYHYDDLRFTVNRSQNFDPQIPEYMAFNADCELIISVGFQSESIDFEEGILSSALKQYLAQEVE